MNKLITLMFSSYMFIILIIPVNATSVKDDDGVSFFKIVSFPVTFALDMISKPLCMLATNGPPRESVISFDDAVKSIADGDYIKAFNDLEKSSAFGNPEGMYHLGLLLLMLPEKNFEVLRQYVQYDSKMGIEYLKTAHEKKFEKASVILSYYDEIVEANRVFTIAYGLDGKEPNVELARKSLRRLIKKGNSVASYFYADALLNQGRLIHPWIMEQELSLLERRKKAVPLICSASAKKMPTASMLMDALEKEDRLYGILCEMIMKDPTLKINGLSLGDSGFQEAYIDHLAGQGYKIHGYDFNPELAFFMKEVMALRVKQVFHFFSEYYVYMQSLSKRFPDKPECEINQPEMLRNMKRDLVGKTVCVLDKLGVTPYLEDKIYDFREHGLMHPITEHDTSRAYAMMIEFSDDFQGH